MALLKKVTVDARQFWYNTLSARNCRLKHEMLSARNHRLENKILKYNLPRQFKQQRSYLDPGIFNL